jgi:hypothetical protein
MANNPGVSEVVDKDGVIADIEAKRFDGTRTFTLQGDVSGTQTWNGESSTAMTLNVSIGAKKVTQDKIGDKAVGTGQIDDHAVGLTQIDTAAMTSTATSGDDRLITSGGVRTEIDNAILNRGKDYGPMTPTQINAISETIPTGSTVHVTAAGTITDGDIEVRNGEDLKYYSGNGTHYWYSMDGEFKLKQTAIPGGQGSTTKTLTGIAQDANGVMTPTFADIQEASTSQKGLVQLAGSVGATVSTENNKAASEKAVRDAIDAMESDIQSGYKPKQTAVTDPTASGNSYSFIDSISQDANGVIAPTKKTVPDASPSVSGAGGTKGLMSATDKEKLDGITAGANKVEASQTNGNIMVDGAETAVYTHPSSGANTSKGDTTAQTPGFGDTFKALSATVDSLGHTTTLGEHTVTIPDAVATPSTDGVGGSAGLMSASDKEKLDDLASGEATKDKDEVIAAALDDHDARIGALEEAVKEENLGTRTADEIDSQVLKIGGDDVAESLASKVKSVKIGSSSGTELNNNGNVVVPLAVATGTTGATAGVMSADDKKTLNDLKTGAVTDVKYVANQSGGGGSLKKTVNGTDSVVMDFMTDAEVDALFDNAMAAAIASA